MKIIGPEGIIKKFRKYEKIIHDYSRARIDDYYSSQCHQILKNRVKRLDNSIDMRAGRTANQWNSKIQIPYGHESYCMTRATLTRNFNPDPLISLEPVYETPWENARDAQETLAQNFRSTEFRDKGFNLIKKLAARYGSVPVISYFQHRPERFKKTVLGPAGFEQAPSVQYRQNVWNDAIHPLNYFQNPKIAEPLKSNFQGWIQRWDVSKLMGLVNSMPDLYIKDNLKKALKDIKDDILKNDNYFEANPSDFNRFAVDVEHLFIRLNFEGNEEDETTYYLEIVGDNIIRIQDNPNDFDVRNVNIITLDQRTEYWWGNTPVEKTFPMENYANILLSMTADNLFRATQNFLFYPAGKIDPAAINDRHKNGGFIPVSPDVLREFKVPVYPWQRQELSTQGVQYLMGEMKEALQRTQSKPDVQRKGVAGGPQNNTATAYMGMEAEADLLNYDYLQEFAGGLKGLGRVNTVMLQQRLDDWFQIRPNPKEPGRLLSKANILGDFAYSVETALSKNTQMEIMKYQNALTWIMNMQATGHPDFQRVNVEKIFRAVIKKFDLDVDMDEVYPEQPAQDAAMMPGQGQGLGGQPAMAGAGAPIGTALPAPVTAQG